MPGAGAMGRDAAAQLGARREGLGLGATAPSARSALGRALRYLLPYRGWIALYLRTSPDGKSGQVIGNVVSEWTQVLGLVVLTKYLGERGSKEGH